jgi:hypothetical protein
MKNFLKEMFSMQEKRISTIIICLIACMSLAFYLYISREDIPETLLTIIITQIYIIGGVNGLNITTKLFKSKVEEGRQYEDNK